MPSPASLVGQGLNSRELFHFRRLRKQILQPWHVADLDHLDNCFRSALIEMPALLLTRYPDSDAITRQFAVGSELSTRASDPSGITALHFAFRHRLVTSCLHIVDALNLSMEARYFEEPVHAVVEKPEMTLLEAAIGRACLERHEFIRHTVHLHGDTCREACKRFVRPYVDLVDGLLARGAKPPTDAAVTIWKTIVDRRMNEGADLALFDALVRNGADLNESDVAYRLRYNTMPPAHSLDHINAGISRMIGLGLDLNRAHPRYLVATVVDGRRHDTAITPLERALLRRDASTFQCLLDHGASLLTARGFRQYTVRGTKVLATMIEEGPICANEQAEMRDLQDVYAQEPMDFVEAVGKTFSPALAASVRAQRMREHVGALSEVSPARPPMSAGRGRARLSL